MSQAPITNPNSDGATYRAAQNASNAALASCFSGNAAPASPVAYQFWLDTSAGIPVLKQRNTANSAWVKPYFDWADSAAGIAGTAGKVMDAAQVKARVDAALALVNVATATAALDFDAVGSYAFAARTSLGTIVAGTTYAGSGLKAAGLLSTSSYNDNTAQSINGPGLSGTWRAMGDATAVGSRLAGTLFLRIA